MRHYLYLSACALLAACSPAMPEGDNAGQAAPASDIAPGDAQHLDIVPVVIRHQGGKADTRLKVEIALTPDQQEKGLMYRTDLKAGDGMLFPMLPARMPSFWMKDTPTSLDMIFIRMDTSIARIAANAEPGDMTPVFAEDPVAAVPELRGGDAERLGIKEGDEVVWGACALEAEPEPVAEPDNYCPD